VEWDHIKPAILGAIMEHYQSGAPVMEGEQVGSGHAEHTGEDGEIVNQIKELLDTRVRPAVAQDGGDITFHGFERGVVYLQMQGACAGCPSSTMTLKMGIELKWSKFDPSRRKCCSSDGHEFNTRALLLRRPFYFGP